MNKVFEIAFFIVNLSFVLGITIQYLVPFVDGIIEQRKINRLYNHLHKENL